MSKLKEHLKLEQSKPCPDKHIVEQLKTILDRGTLTFEEWKLSGRFVPREHFLEHSPKTKLHDDCTEVVKYFCGHIEALKTNQFYVSPNIHCTAIEPLEKFIWGEIEKKLW